MHIKVASLPDLSHLCSCQATTTSIYCAFLHVEKGTPSWCGEKVHLNLSPPGAPPGGCCCAVHNLYHYQADLDLPQLRKRWTD